MRVTAQNYTEFITEVLYITHNVQGAGLVSEVESVISKYDLYFNTTPVPESVANWVGNLYDLIDNCEGAELERGLVDIKSPLQRKVKA
jgi:hypothetical protein